MDIKDNKQCTAGVRALHLSDFHVGLSSQGWMWPTLKHKFLSDLDRMHSVSGPWHVVIFSGDLTQRGSKEEFTRLTEILAEIWESFNKLGSSPKLFPIPGNHDLVRPNESDPAALIMAEWWDRTTIHDPIWSTVASPYRTLITESFANYTSWLEDLKETTIPLPTFTTGLLPGDISATIEGEGQNLGIVGLNSAWLQLGGGDYRKKIHVDARQLLSVTHNDPDSWCSKHDLNLLVTHHPCDWLHHSSFQMWNGDIDTNGRFDAHLFGHMHEAGASTLSQNSATTKVSIQAASIFGLEKIRDNIERIHGYSSLNLFRDAHQTDLSLWPRRVYKRANGDFKFIADPDFDLNELEQLILTRPRSKETLRSSSKLTETSNQLVNTDNVRRILKTIQKIFHFSQAALDVRKAEQDLCTDALRDESAVWLVSDWGFGTDEFIRVIQNRLNKDGAAIYLLDFHSFKNRDEILAGVQSKLGCTFEQLCELLSSEEDHFLIFDDIALGDNPETGTSNLCSDLQIITDAVRDYCPNTRIIVRSRRIPNEVDLKVVTLRPLDEPDTGLYLAGHELGGQGFALADNVSKIFRHTDGIPSRIDGVLKNLQIVGMDGLHNLDSDVAGKNAVLSNAPSGLCDAVAELIKSGDPVAGRAFKLLKVLTVFPQGEQLERVKRFWGAEAFYPSHAVMLLENAFVDAVDIPNIGQHLANTQSAKALVVRRPVREHLYNLIPASELKRLNNQALQLYFGANWSTRGIKSHTSIRFDKINCGSWEIGNANTIVLRAVKEAAEGQRSKAVLDTLALANSYCAALMKGDHFRSVVSLCEDVLAILKNFDTDIELGILTSNYGTALRMIGQSKNALNILEPLIKEPITKNQQSLLIDIALAYKSLDNNEQAINTANKCEKVAPNTNFGLQAKSIVLELSRADPGRIKKLEALEIKARKQNAYTVANNIAMTLAYDSSDNNLKRDRLNHVSGNAYSKGDYYNAIRSSVELAKLALSEGKEITSTEQVDLINAYHYLHAQRMGSLFNKCHDVLWQVFESGNDITNLLRLFRHSSFVWRLQGKEKNEHDYLHRLASNLSVPRQINGKSSSQELVYFIARTAHALPKIISGNAN